MPVSYERRLALMTKAKRWFRYSWCFKCCGYSNHDDEKKNKCVCARNTYYPHWRYAWIKEQERLNLLYAVKASEARRRDKLFLI